MTISEVKATLEKVAGVPVEEQRLFNPLFAKRQLDGGSTCASNEIQAGSELTMMQIWTLFVRECESEEQRAADRAIGADVPGDSLVEMHIIEGVERHWKLASLKLKIEELTGISPSHQILTDKEGTVLDSEASLSQYGQIHNRSELVLTQLSDPKPPQSQIHGQSMANDKQERLETKEKAAKDRCDQTIAQQMARGCES